MKPQVTITIQTDLDQAAQILAGIHGYILPLGTKTEEPEAAKPKAAAAGSGKACAQCHEVKPYVRDGGFCKDCRLKKTTEPDRLVEPQPAMAEPDDIDNEL